MNLADRVTDEIKSAMRARDEQKLAALRALRGEILKLSKLALDKEVTDDDVLKLVKSQIKQRQDAIAMFEKGGRADLIAIDAEQIKHLQVLLPTQISDDALTEIIDKAIELCNASSAKDMGKVMKETVALVRQTGLDSNNRRVSELVRERLATVA